MATIPKGLSYMKSRHFIRTLILFGDLVLGIASLSKVFFDLRVAFYFWGEKGKMDFAMFALVASSIFIIVMAIFFAAGLHENFPSINWLLVMFVSFLVLSSMLLIAGCLMAKTYHSYLQEDKNSSGVSFSHGSDKTCVTCIFFIGAMVFCFLAFIFCASDAHDYYVLLRHQTPTTTEAPVTSAK